MSVWQAQTQKTAIVSRSYRRHLQAKIDEIFKNLPDVCDIADDILVVGYDTHVKRHDKML